MSINKKILQYDSQFSRLVEAIAGGSKSIYLHGLLSESTGLFSLSLSENLNSPVFLVSSSRKKAMEVADEINKLSEGAAIYYPEEDMQFFESYAVDSPLEKKRLAVMDRLLMFNSGLSGPPIISCTLKALKRPVSPPLIYVKDIFTIEAGLEYDLNGLINKLISMGYERTITVEHAGEFALRGGILDIFAPALKDPVRIEFFADEIDSIRYFDIESQRSKEKLDKVRISPAKSLSFSKEAISTVIKGIRQDLKAFLKLKNTDPVRQRVEDKFGHVLETLEQTGGISNTDLVSTYLSDDEKSHLYDYLPDKGIIIFTDIDRLIEEDDKSEETLIENLSSLYEQGELLKSHLNIFSNKDLLEDMEPYCRINLTQILKSLRNLKTEVLLQIRSLEEEYFERRWDDLVKRLKDRQAKKYRTILYLGDAFEPTKSRLRESNVDFISLSGEDLSEDILPGQILVNDLELNKGFSFPDSKIMLLSSSNILPTKKRSRRNYRPRKKKDLLNYQDLAIGDYVVHEIYGIGTYEGTEIIEYGGVRKDFIKISYKGSDKLYVSTDEMDLVSKYIGAGGPKPRVSSLGAAEWKRSKERAKKAVEAIADDLVELYAKRSKIKGFAFSPDISWQEEFEEAFPYEDTPSQVRATAEIKADMETDKPMDRLLCGDVGYGKTEVALRAAFKAIMDGKQVVFLAPTTILVQQHYQTMLERFQRFPATIDFMSRFKSPEKQKDILKRLKEGSIDMLVGTHRLLSKDVKFKDLGLLIIDEEQRFGVKDKEKMKKIKENVDVLTLSATPIPRTLQLSLTGIRDMSLLEEPPEDRYPTISYVLEEDGAVIKEAIERELDREGQVYIIHNRVHDIHKIYEKLQNLVPEAEIVVGHGQMSARRLEAVMEEFVSGRSDILLATTIIESGMDISNANTLIVFNSDRMGLAQLYQLKGRIGRSDRQSYAYFTYDRSKVLTEKSEKRLKAIRDFTEFGSGYKIAMRDLELRGAGNLLGESQSGHIESIGYELYVRMLEKAVSKAKGEKAKTDYNQIRVDIKISAYIPDEYIQQSSDKIIMYRQIAAIENQDDFSTIVEELIDRYGDVPRPVLNLMNTVLIKKRAGDLGFTDIREEGDELLLSYPVFEHFTVETLKYISDNYKGDLAFDFKKKAAMKLKKKDTILKDISDLLTVIEKAQEEIGRKENNEEKEL